MMGDECMAAKVATEFSTTANYAINDMVLYGGVLYKFTGTHTAGEWNSSQATEVDSSKEQQITRIIAGMDNAEKAIDYVETITFEPVQIKGTRYKYVLTNAPDPRE